jgi:hypothetical protein
VVSGSISSPLRGAFHLSLTVLVHYRSLKVFSLGGWSPLLPTRLHVARGTQDANASGWAGLYGTLTRSGAAFQPLQVAHLDVCVGPTTPVPLARGWFGLFPLRSPLLRESRLISFRRATEMFQFTHGLPPGLCIEPGVSSHHAGGVAPLGLSGLIACVQLPLNVSPVAASFFSFQRQGIHLVLCVACSFFF